MESTPSEPGGTGPPRKPPRSRRAKRPADLDLELGDHYKWKAESRESRAEITSRLRTEKARLDHDLRKDFVLFVAVVAIVASATAACLFLVLSNRYSPAIQNAAMALLAAIVSGGVGYATGKSNRPS